MKTAHEIIDETIEFYSKNPRAIVSNNGNKNQCVYSTKQVGKHVEKFAHFVDVEDKRCAYGRCWTDEAIENYGHVFGIVSIFLSKAGLQTVDDVLKDEYKGHSVEFWEDLQKLHDYDSNWNDGELTVYGLLYVQCMRETY